MNQCFCRILMGIAQYTVYVWRVSFSLFLAGEIIQKPFLMLENSELLLLSQTTFKFHPSIVPHLFSGIVYLKTLHHTKTSWVNGILHAFPDVTRRSGWAVRFSWVTFGNGLTFFICQTGGVFSLIGKGTPQDKKRPWDFQAVLILDVIFLRNVFLDFNPFGCYMNHEKNQTSLIFGWFYLRGHQWLALGLHKFQKMGSIPRPGSWGNPAKRWQFYRKAVDILDEQIDVSDQNLWRKGGLQGALCSKFILLIFYLQGSYEFCQSPTVDGSEIHKNHPTCMKPCK